MLLCFIENISRSATAFGLVPYFDEVVVMLLDDMFLTSSSSAAIFYSLVIAWEPPSAKMKEVSYFKTIRTFHSLKFRLTN